MLHIHFGAGRLGLGLIAPAFRTGASELHLFNRAVPGDKVTGGTSLGSTRRNALLGAGLGVGRYFIEKPGGSAADRREVAFDGFTAYGDEGPAATIEAILDRSRGAKHGVVVTASVIAIEHYGPVMEALRAAAKRRTADEAGVGPIYFVACENTLSAPAVFADEAMGPMIDRDMLAHVVPVHAMVDRMCVGLEETAAEDGPAVLVRAEEYGSVKLELGTGGDGLVALCRGGEVEFSRHVDTEKQIKSWLLNGTHWVIALKAFEESRGDQDMKLNEFLAGDPGRMESARAAMREMREMREGVSTILRGGDRFRGFVEEVDVDAYLDEAAETILRRFCATEDPITRILARFRAPTPEAVDTIVSFSKRFADRVDEPMRAYEAKTGRLPRAASRGVASLMRLVANGMFIKAAA